MGTITIFQKTDCCYVRIFANMPYIENDRALNTFIPNHSEVIKTIEQVKNYFGGAFVVNEWYMIAYESIVIK